MTTTESDLRQHPFRPRLLASGEPTLVCRACHRWWDDEAHQASQEGSE